MMWWLYFIGLGLALGQVTNSPKGLGMAGQSVRCHDCRADHNSCNVGECQGVVCVKMETSNMDNERKAVYKSCSDEYEPTQCKQSGFGSKLITRCTCEGDFCNNDDNLNAAGLQPTNSVNKQGFSIFYSSILFIIMYRFVLK